MALLLRRFPFWAPLLLFLLPEAGAQNGRWQAGGYAKSLQSVLRLNLQTPFPFDTLLIDNLLHHRLNLSWSPHPNLALHTAWRNRLFWGDQVRLGGEAFTEQLDNPSEFFDLSISGTDSKGLAYHSTLDRLYLEWFAGKWELRLGRQRINWGIGTLWNPNDLFNTFNFVDFDYEERPGSDALRIRYATGYAGGIELAVTAFEELREGTFAARWQFNRWNYDFQLIGGYARHFLTLGGGWAGNLRNAGFKGEFAFFHPLEAADEGSFSATLGLDYVFSNSLYLNAGFLFNSLGTNASSAEIFTFELSARNLYPYKYTALLQLAYPPHPLMNLNLTALYSPSRAHALFLFPTYTLSVAENWDLDFVAQVAFSRERSYTSTVQAFFLRLKYSY